MSTTTVFDSKINELIGIIESLKKESKSEKFMNALTGLFGLKTQDKEALGEYTKSVEGLLDYARAIKETLTNLSNTNTKTQIENTRLNAQQQRAINTLNIQKTELDSIRGVLNEYKKTNDGLKKDNTAIQEANQTLTTQNQAQQEQNQTLTTRNEEQQEQNQTLTAQNASQQKQIADMDNNLLKLTVQLNRQTEALAKQTEKIKQINNSNDKLSSQLKELKTIQEKTERNANIAATEFNKIKKAQDAHINKIKKDKEKAIAGLRISANNKLKKQKEEFEKSIAGIKQESGKSIADKEAEIKKITEQHNNKQNEINTQLTNLTATSNATIGDLKKELSSFKTEEKLSKEDQEKQKKMLSGVTRVFPLGWKNSKGFNIGNITTQLRGEKPYSATDTIDYYLHTLFNGKNQGQSEISISSRHVPIIKTSGGKKNRMKKSKKSNKSKNNKTKKQRGKR